MSTSAVSYTYLRNCLAAQQWKEADDETARIMLEIAQREAEGWLDCESIARFPCGDLITIDELWMQYSNNRFGINIWKDIWLRFGKTVDKNTERRIGEAVGWYEEGWKFEDKIDFSLSAPVGHLPYLLQAKQGVLLRLLGGSEMMHSALAWRFKSCLSTDSEAEQLLDVVINVQPEDIFRSEQYNQRGMELLREQRCAEALANFEEAQKLDPLSPLFHQNKAVALYFLGRFSEALQSCDSAIDHYPQPFNLLVIHQLKADIFQAQGRLEEALASFQHSLNLNPDDFYALRPHCQKALLLAKLKRYEEALDACEVTLSLYPHQTEISELRLEILASLHNNSGAAD